jgi:hypothetical protein
MSSVCGAEARKGDVMDPRKLKAAAMKNVRSKGRPLKRNQKLSQAIADKTITREEAIAVKRGDMCLEGPYLTNLNSATAQNPTGTHILLYPDRAATIMGRRLLGLDDGEIPLYGPEHKPL